MCNLGRHRTGTVIGCLRRLQNWSLSAIFDEFRRFTGGKSSPQHEQFIELFDTELIEIPEDYDRLPFISLNLTDINSSYKMPPDSPLKLTRASSHISHLTFHHH